MGNISMSKEKREREREREREGGEKQKKKNENLCVKVTQGTTSRRMQVAITPAVMLDCFLHPVHPVNITDESWVLN